MTLSHFCVEGALSRILFILTPKPTIDIQACPTTSYTFFCVVCCPLSCFCRVFAVDIRFGLLTVAASGFFTVVVTSLVIFVCFSTQYLRCSEFPTPFCRARFIPTIQFSIFLSVLFLRVLVLTVGGSK